MEAERSALQNVDKWTIKGDEIYGRRVKSVFVFYMSISTILL